jgi:hypothetical protein
MISLVAPLTPGQLRTRERVETLIALMAPGLNVILSVGDRISRLVEPEDHDYYPTRPLAGPEQTRALTGTTGEASDRD